jgi:hypothetical protein
MPEKRPPKDPNQLAKYIVDVTSGEAEKIEPPRKDPAAVELGRRGGLKSAKTRNQRLSPTKRRAIAKKAAKARWKKSPKRIKVLHSVLNLRPNPSLHSVISVIPVGIIIRQGGLETALRTRSYILAS